MLQKVRPDSGRIQRQAKWYLRSARQAETNVRPLR